jgi:hypothetical protein
LRRGRKGRGRRKALTRGAAKSKRERRESGRAGGEGDGADTRARVAARGREGRARGVLGWLLGRARPTRGGEWSPRGRERGRGEWAGVAHAEERKGKGRAGLGQGVWVAFFPSSFPFLFHTQTFKQNYFVTFR